MELENLNHHTEKTITFESKEENLYFENVFDIEPKELSTKMNQVRIIDVRQPEEFSGELGHIPKAQLMVLDTISEKIHTLSKEETIVFVCRSGSRSARATSYAVQNGFTHVYNLKGGMILWNDLHLITEA